MKKILALTLAVLMLLPCLAACAEEEPILPPVRESENPAKARYTLGNENLSTLFEEAEIIVRLRVGDWISDAYFDNFTCFKASVLEVYKGSVGSEIVLVQSGTTKRTYQEYPLFTYGEELLLFLKSMETHIAEDKLNNPDFDYPDFEYKNAYSIVGGPLNVWNIATLKTGDTYIVPQLSFTPLCEDIMNIANCDNHGSSNTKGMSEAAASASLLLMEIDPYYNPGPSPEYVFKLDDIKAYFISVQENTREIK